MVRCFKLAFLPSLQLAAAVVEGRGQRSASESGPRLCRRSIRWVAASGHWAGLLGPGGFVCHAAGLELAV